MRLYRHLILLTCLTGALQAQTGSYLLTVELQSDRLRVAAPRLHFLEGKPLERLRNGSAVTYVFDLSIESDQKSIPATGLRERFILSFDLWEEKFSVVQAGPPGHRASHLTSAMAEAWCLENMPIPRPAWPPERAFVIKLECWEEQNETEAGNESGLTLASLIDVFSRKGREAAPRWRAVSATLRLADLNGKRK